MQCQCKGMLRQRLEQENLSDMKEVPYLRILVNDVQPRIGGMNWAPTCAIIKVVYCVA